MPFGKEFGDDVQLDQFEGKEMCTDEKKYLIRTKELLGKLEKEKNNLQYWLELLSIQELARDSIFQGQASMINEKKLSIVEKALDSQLLQSNLHLRLLRLDLIRKSLKSEDFFKVVSKEFINIVNLVDDSSMVIQSLHLLYKHGHFTSFNGSLLRKNISAIIQETAGLIERETSSAKIKRLEQQVTLCFFHGLQTELRMGYSEKVFGVVVAMLELNITTKPPIRQIEESWEDRNINRIGDVDLQTGETMDEFDNRLFSINGMNEEGIRNELFTADCSTLQELTSKEKLYSQLTWRAVKSKEELVVDSYSEKG